MNQYKFESVTDDGKIVTLTIASLTTNETEEYRVGDYDTLPEAMAELLATYDIAPCSMGDIIANTEHLDYVCKTFFAQFKGVEILYSQDAEKFIAKIKNGDTGHFETGEGDRALEALSDLARSHGFKSKLPDDGGLTLLQWFTDFQYGFNRISDDLLNAELEGIYAPEKGSW